MIDLKLKANSSFQFDIEMSDSDIASEAALETAVIISLFTDKRVDGERGFFGDSLENDSWGSKIWTLQREKLTDQTKKKLEDYAKESLQWLIDDKIAKKITVESEIVKPARINLLVKIYKGDSVSDHRFDNIWGEQ